MAINIAVFLTIWWTVLFAVLPFGVRSQQDANEVVPGTDPGAPARPRLVAKALWTTGLSVLLFGLYLLGRHFLTPADFG